MPANGFAVLALLVLLGTAGLVALTLAAVAWGLTQRNRLVVRRGLQGAVGLTGGYLALLALAGAASRERVLPPGSEKYFCELDCHLAYRVERVEPLEGAGPGGRTLWAVRLRTRFDERTISAARSREAPLWPNPRRLALIDRSGRQHPPADGLEPLLAGMGLPSTPLTRELRPGESYLTSLVFALPAGAVPSKLILQDDLPVNRFIIGHERSLFHAPVLLALGKGEG